MTLTIDRVRKELAVLLEVKEEAVSQKLISYVFDLHKENEKLIHWNNERLVKINIAKDILDSI